MSVTRREPQPERGASLVEFALVLPLLIVLLFGLIEFSWGFAQALDVKQVAREVGRLAAVDETQADIDAKACGSRLAEVGTASVSGGTTAGETAIITVSADLHQITGLFGEFFGSAGVLDSTIEVRLEQDLTNWSGTTCP